MTLTINLKPELESRLRDEAARSGVNPDAYVVQALEERLRQIPVAAVPITSPEVAASTHGAPAAPEFLTERFKILARQWKQNRGPGSSLTKIASDPAYLEIIHMGKAALPFILADLEAEPDFWFAALRRITGQNPISPEDQGDLHAMAAAWLQWGRANDVRW